MFTGIVRDIGVVSGIVRSGSGYKLSVRSKGAAIGAKIGDSICLNGVCLTVSSMKGEILDFDLTAETVRSTGLASLASGDRVNLEGSLSANGTIDGHFVLGHVDCVGVVEYAGRDTGGGFKLRVRFPKEFGRLVVEKGSIAVDGASLTAGRVGENAFEAYIIPHTLKATTLGMKSAGNTVNLEFDILGKYILKDKGSGSRTPISEEFLRSKGF
ncbi:MAG: riboflavin synthase [Candidatus Omnitrophota bacterium]